MNANKNDKLIIIKDNLYLGEAAFLDDLLRREGICAQLKKEEEKTANDAAKYSVRVEKRVSNKARSIADIALQLSVAEENNDNQQKTGKPGKRLYQAIAGAALGFIVWVRIGRLLKNNLLYIIISFVVVITIFSFLYFRPGSSPEYHREKVKR